MLCCSQMCWSKAVVGRWEESPAPMEHCLWLIIYVTLMHPNKDGCWEQPSSLIRLYLMSLTIPHRCSDIFFPIPSFLAEINWAAHNAKSLPTAHYLARPARHLSRHHGSQQLSWAMLRNGEVFSLAPSPDA